MSIDENQTPTEPISIYSHVAQLVQAMTEISWQKLGLHADMVTGKVEPNLSEAKVAIDLTAYLAGVLEPQLDSEDLRQVQNIVRDLRLNYVQKAKEISS